MSELLIEAPDLSWILSWILDPQRAQKLSELACIKSSIEQCSQGALRGAAGLIRTLVTGIDRLSEMNRSLSQELAKAKSNRGLSKTTIDDIFEACSIWRESPIQEFGSSIENRDGQYTLSIHHDKPSASRILYRGVGETVEIAIMDVIRRIAVDAEAELISIENRLAKIRGFIEQKPIS